MAQTLKPNRSDNRGGKRENAGRKAKDTKGFTIRCKPENIELVRNFIKENRL
jgi:hypothetical protein